MDTLWPECYECEHRKPCVRPIYVRYVGDSYLCHACRGFDDCPECEDAAEEFAASRSETHEGVVTL